MNKTTKAHHAPDSTLSASSTLHPSVEPPLQSDFTDNKEQDQQSNEGPSSEELFCPGLPSAALAPLVLRTHFGPSCDVVKQDYLGKQELKHRRYFVLRAGSNSGPSRLEWYKSQEKFTADGDMGFFGSNKQGVIFLRCCLGVSRISSSRKDYKVALYAKEQTLVIVGKHEQDQHEWYVAIKKLMEEELEEGFDEDDAGYCTLPPAAFFKQVWPVTVKPRGIGRSEALAGDVLLCLTASSLVLVRVGHDHGLPSVTLPLLAVRRFGHLDGSFFLELGRSAPHGPGEIWMEARDEGDSALAQQIHEVVRGVVRALRVLPDFSWTSTTSKNSGSLAPKRSRPKHREKPVLCGTHHSSAASPLVPCEGPHTQSQSDLSTQESYMEMKEDCHSPVKECVTEGWGSSQEKGLGYMLMSPQIPQEVHQDEYMTMASPQKHNQSTCTSFSSFSSDSDGPSPHHVTEQTPPPWMLYPVQQSNIRANQSQLSMSCPPPPHSVTPLTTSSPLRGATVLRPLPRFSGRPSGDDHSVRRYLLSCLPSCLRADKS